MRFFHSLGRADPVKAGTLLGSLGVAASVAWLAWRWGLLTRAGWVAATLVGGILFGLGGWPWAGLLLGFFVPSAWLSRWALGRKAAFRQRFAKSARRDAVQVLANGGVATLCALGQGLHPTPLWWVAAAGALAAAAADTWATEVGVLSPHPPRDLLRWRPVPPGTSGAVSVWGLTASAAASLWMAWLAHWGASWPASVAVALGGMAGSLLDSLLGASVQARYYCPACRMTTEHHPRHTCGALTQQVHGWHGLNNDGVNLLATLVGALVAGGLFVWWASATP